MSESRRRVYSILEQAQEGDQVSRVFDIFIMTLIILNVIAIILGSVQEFSSKYEDYLLIFELFSVISFSVEYLLRLWSCTADNRYKNPITGRIRFSITPMALIDLLAILPFYVPMLIPMDLRFLRAVRLIRLFRLFKMGRYSEAMRKFGLIFRSKREELLISLFVVTILLIIASSLMYHFECEAQPEAFSSIPAAMWWGVVTLTTVGYGDVCPVTSMGKILGTIIAVLGIGMVALPAGILGSGFVEQIQRKDQILRTCPHCGKSLEVLPPSGNVKK